MQDVRLISLTPLAGSRGGVATSLARAIGDDDLMIMLSGPEGSGKSAILAAVVATLAYGGMRVIRVNNPDQTTMGQRELAARILGRPMMGSPAQLVAEAITNLLATTDDGRVLLVVDDAHTLSDQAMELLLVITSPGRRGIRSPQLLLAGRGAFWERPWRDELREVTDLAEKISLEPLTAEDARDFVLDEAKASGGTIADVTPDALVALVRCSSGLTAHMDHIVTAAVALGNTRRATVLTVEIVDAVVTPDTLVEPPCTGAGPLSDSDAAVAAPAIEAPTTDALIIEAPPTEVRAPVAGKRFRIGGFWIAGVGLAAMAAAAVGLVLTLRTEAPSPSDRGVAVTSPATTREAATAPVSPNVARSVPLQQDNATESAAATAPSNTTSADSTQANTTPADVAASSSVVSTPVAGSVGEPPAAVNESGNPQAPVTVLGDAPVASAPPSGHVGVVSSAAETLQGGNQQAAADPALSAATGDTGTAPQAASPETSKPEPPAVAPAAAPALATVPAPTQPVAPALVAPTPIAPLPAAPPPVAVLPAVPQPAAAPPAVPPPAAAPPVAQPQTALPPAPIPPTTASLSPSAIASLLQRGKDKLASGDILSARLYFERAGATGSEEGAMAAGRTYDPGYLATIDAPGLQANVKRAIDWYRVAADHGNAEAQKRIDALSAASTR